VLKETGKQEDGRGKQDGQWGGLRWMGAGVEFCGVICLFCFGGYKLDELFDTSPFLLLTGFFISFVGMVYLFYKDSKK
jgi:F0F1-type ATP synthase assembly protein I